MGQIWYTEQSKRGDDFGDNSWVWPGAQATGLASNDQVTKQNNVGDDEKFLEFERIQKKGLNWQEITRDVPTTVWKVRLVELVSTS